MSARHSSSKASPLVLDPNSARLVGGVAPPPLGGAPTPPPDETILTRREAHLIARPQKAQLDVAPEAAREVRASTAFAEIVGARVARPAELADAIEVASAWYREAKASEAWCAYAASQSAVAWGGLLKVLAKVRAPLVSAQGADAALERELHAFTRLVTARSDAAVRARATRRKQTPKAAPASSLPSIEGGDPRAPAPDVPSSPTVPMANGAHAPPKPSAG